MSFLCQWQPLHPQDVQLPHGATRAIWGLPEGKDATFSFSWPWNCEVKALRGISRAQDVLLWSGHERTLWYLMGPSIIPTQIEKCHSVVPSPLPDLGGLLQSAGRKCHSVGVIRVPWLGDQIKRKRVFGWENWNEPSSTISCSGKGGGKIPPQSIKKPLRLIDFGKLHLIPAYLNLKLMRLDWDWRRYSKQIPLQYFNVLILSIQ